MRLEKFKKKEREIDEELEEEEEEENEEEEEEEEEEIKKEKEKKKKYERGDIEPVFSIVGYKVYKNSKEYVYVPAEQEHLAVFMADIYKRMSEEEED
ncbi:MAG: hypothetical protein QXS37_06815 [Candidatus Aenigmatarchaeota archaeon]